MPRPRKGLLLFVAVTLLMFALPELVVASSSNPYTKSLKEAKAEFTKAKNNFEKLIRKGNANMVQLMAAMLAYTRARSRYDSIKSLYDKWEKVNKAKKPTVKRVRITYNVPWVSTADIGQSDSRVKAKEDMTTAGCCPMPRYLNAVANYGTKSATYFRITKGFAIAQKYINQDVKMKGIFRRDKYLYSGTVEVLKVKATKPVHKQETKVVTIERQYYNEIMPLCGTTDNKELQAEAKDLGCIALPRTSMSVQLDVGKTFRFGLETNASTGYSWDYHFSVAGIAQVVPTIRPLYDSPTTNNSQGQMIVGAPTTRWFTVRGQRAGRTKMILEYRRMWEDKQAAKRMEIDIQVQGSITPPPFAKATYHAVEKGGRRYRVTNDTAHVVQKYVGQTVELTGEFTALDFIAMEKNTSSSADNTTKSDQKSLIGIWRPTPTADGIVKAIRVKPRVEPGKIQKHVVRIEGYMTKSMPPQYHLYCVQESIMGRKVYDIVSGEERCRNLMGSMAEVTGVWNFPDVWIPEISPRGTVRVVRVAPLATLYQGAQENKEKLGTDLNNPFGN